MTSVALSTRTAANTNKTETDTAPETNIHLAKLEGMITYGDIKAWTYTEKLDPKRKMRNEYYASEGGCNPFLTDRFLTAMFSDNSIVVLEFSPDKYHIGDRNDIENISAKNHTPKNLSASDPVLEKDYRAYLIHDLDYSQQEPIAEGAVSRKLFWELYDRLSKESPYTLSK